MRLEGRTEYALAAWDDAKARWLYLNRSASYGNLQATPDPSHAMTWPNPGLARLWADELPEKTKEVLREKPRHLIAVRAVIVGDPEPFEIAAPPAPQLDPTAAAKA